MSQQLDSGFRTFTADAAIAQYARVVYEADGRIVAAGLTQIGHGIAQQEAYAAGDAISVKLWSAPGTFKMIAEEAVDVGDTLYTAAAGKMQDTSTSTAYILAVALEVGTADNDVIECMLVTGTTSTPVA